MIMKRSLLILLMVVSTMMLSCNPNDNDDNNSGGDGNNTGVERPTVVTKSVEEVTDTTAKVDGQVTEDGGTEVIERGICWNTDGEPTIDDWHTTEGEGLGMFTSELNDLKSHTTYYVRAYATNEVGTSYGMEISFKTSTINGHEYVDLGLPSGKKWATCNVGASSVEDYGDYFSWGEIKPKEVYDEDSYQYWNDLNGNGYWDWTGESTINTDISGKVQHDAATANWGDGWRMPTKAEMQELAEYCEWGWTEVNGVNGMIVIGPNGSCIFLPAAGCRNRSSLNGAGEYGYYWTSSYGGYHSGQYAYSLDFGAPGKYVDYGNRRLGQPVRPITD